MIKLGGVLALLCVAAAAGAYDRVAQHHKHRAAQTDSIVRMMSLVEWNDRIGAPLMSQCGVRVGGFARGSDLGVITVTLLGTPGEIRCAECLIECRTGRRAPGCECGR